MSRYFDGSAFIDFGSIPDIHLEQGYEWSFFCFFRMDAVDTARVLFGKWNATVGQRQFIVRAGDHIEVGVNDATIYSSPSVLVANTWYAILIKGTVSDNIQVWVADENENFVINGDSFAQPANAISQNADIWLGHGGSGEPKHVGHMQNFLFTQAERYKSDLKNFIRNPNAEFSKIELVGGGGALIYAPLYGMDSPELDISGWNNHGTIQNSSVTDKEFASTGGFLIYDEDSSDQYDLPTSLRPDPAFAVTNVALSGFSITHSPESATARVDSVFPIILPADSATWDGYYPDILYVSHDAGDLSGWEDKMGNAVFNSTSGIGTAEESVVSGFGRTGQHSLKMTITGADGLQGGSQAVRLLRRWWINQAEVVPLPDAYYTAYLYFPNEFEIGDFWNVHQFKWHSDSRGSQPMFSYNIGRNANGMYLFIYHRAPFAGTFNPGSDATDRSRFQAGTPLRVRANQWIQIQSQYTRSTIDGNGLMNPDGRLTVWQDGLLIFDLVNIYTRRDNDLTGRINWGVNNYAPDITPPNPTIYADDISISTRFLAPNFPGSQAFHEAAIPPGVIQPKVAVARPDTIGADDITNSPPPILSIVTTSGPIVVLGNSTYLVPAAIAITENQPGSVRYGGVVAYSAPVTASVQSQYDGFVTGSIIIEPQPAIIVQGQVGPWILQSSIVVTSSPAAIIAQISLPQVDLSGIPISPNPSRLVVTAQGPESVHYSSIVVSAIVSSVTDAALTVIQASVTLSPLPVSVVAEQSNPTVYSGSIALSLSPRSVASIALGGSVHYSATLVSGVIASALPVSLDGTVTLSSEIVNPPEANLFTDQNAGIVAIDGDYSANAGPVSIVALSIDPLVIRGAVVVSSVVTAIPSSVSPNLLFSSLVATASSVTSVSSSAVAAVGLGSQVITTSEALVVTSKIDPDIGVMGGSTAAPNGIGARVDTGGLLLGLSSTVVSGIALSVVASASNPVVTASSMVVTSSSSSARVDAITDGATQGSLTLIGLSSTVALVSGPEIELSSVTVIRNVSAVTLSNSPSVSLSSQVVNLAAFARSVVASNTSPNLSILKGSITIALAVRNTVPSTIGPSNVRLGSTIADASEARLVITTRSPQVVLNGISMTPDAVSVTGNTFGTAFESGITVVASGPADLVSFTYLEFLILGSDSVSPSHSTVITGKNDPLPVLGNISFSPQPAVATIGSIGSAEVYPDAASAVAKSTSPVFVAGGLELIPVQVIGSTSATGSTSLYGSTVASPAKAIIYTDASDGLPVKGSLAIEPSTGSILSESLGVLVHLSSTSNVPAGVHLVTSVISDSVVLGDDTASPLAASTRPETEAIVIQGSVTVSTSPSVIVSSHRVGNIKYGSVVVESVSNALVSTRLDGAQQESIVISALLVSVIALSRGEGALEGTLFLPLPDHKSATASPKVAGPSRGSGLVGSMTVNPEGMATELRSVGQRYRE